MFVPLTGIDLAKCHINLKLLRKGATVTETHKVTPHDLDAGLAEMHRRGTIDFAGAEFVTVFDDGHDTREYFTWDNRRGCLVDFVVLRDRLMGQLETFLIKALLENHTRDCEECGHSGATVIRRALRKYYPFREAGDTDDKLTKELRSLMYKWRTDPDTRPYGLHCKDVERGPFDDKHTAYEWWFDAKIRNSNDDISVNAPPLTLKLATSYWKELEVPDGWSYGQWFMVRLSETVWVRLIDPRFNMKPNKKWLVERASELMKELSVLEPESITFEEKIVPWPEDENDRFFICAPVGSNLVEEIHKLRRMHQKAPSPPWSH